MDDKTLVDRLRNLAEEWFEMCDDIHEPLNEAATRIEALEAALRDMVQAVCGETGFAAAVRNDAGIKYPWPALDFAEERAKQALESQP